MRATWLPGALRAAGLTVVEHDGWETRGFQPWAPRFGIVHATAAPRSQSDATQVAIVRDGHSTLRGPIANAVVDRSGRWHVVASGQCNTALTGWAGPADGLGNEHLLGVEACNNNNRPGEPNEPWPDVQYQAYVRGWAVICTRMGWGAQRCVGHKEHQPGDKSDPSFDMGTFRRRVAAAIEGGDVSAADLQGWTTARVPDKQQRPVARLVAWGNEYARRGWELAREHSADLAAIKAQVLGEDVQAAVREELDRAAERERAERQAELGEVTEALEQAGREREALAELVRQAASGELPAEQVEEALRRVLERTALVVPE